MLAFIGLRMAMRTLPRLTQPCGRVFNQRFIFPSSRSVADSPIRSTPELNTKLRSLVKSLQLRSAEQLYQRMILQGIQRDYETYALVLEMYGQQKRFPLITSTLSTMERRQISHTLETVAAAVCALTRCGAPVDHLWKWFQRFTQFLSSSQLPQQQQQQQVAVAVFQAVMSYLLKEQRNKEQVFEIVPKMRQLLEAFAAANVQPTVEFCNMVLTAYSREGDLKSILEWLALMETKYNVTPDVSSFSAALTAAGNAGHMDMMHEFLQRATLSSNNNNNSNNTHNSNENAKMRKLYSALMNVYKREGDLEQMQLALGDLTKAGIAPTTLIYNCFLDYHASRGNATPITEIVRRMEHTSNSNARPDTVTYAIALKGYSRARDFPTVLKLFELLKQRRWVTPVLLIEFIDACGFHNRSDLVDEVMQDSSLKHQQQLHVVASFAVLNAVMEAYLRCGHVKKAANIALSMRDRGYIWTSKTAVVFAAMLPAAFHDGSLLPTLESAHTRLILLLKQSGKWRSSESVSSPSPQFDAVYSKQLPLDVNEKVAFQELLHQCVVL